MIADLTAEVNDDPGFCQGSGLHILQGVYARCLAWMRLIEIFDLDRN